MRPCSSWYSTTARRRSRWSSAGDVGSLASAWGRAWSSRAPLACTATGSRCSTPPTSCGCRSLTTARWYRAAAAPWTSSRLTPDPIIDQLGYGRRRGGRTLVELGDAEPPARRAAHRREPLMSAENLAGITRAFAWLLANAAAGLGVTGLPLTWLYEPDPPGGSRGGVWWLRQAHARPAPKL